MPIIQVQIYNLMHYNHAGLVAEIKLVDSFSIQPELLYSTQGATYKMQ
jgi:hypothetical protein